MLTALIFSMGGHGALICALKNPSKYKVKTQMFCTLACDEIFYFFSVGICFFANRKSTAMPMGPESIKGVFGRQHSVTSGRFDHASNFEAYLRFATTFAAFIVRLRFADSVKLYAFLAILTRLQKHSAKMLRSFVHCLTMCLCLVAYLSSYHAKAIIALYNELAEELPATYVPLQDAEISPSFFCH